MGLGGPWLELDGVGWTLVEIDGVGWTLVGIRWGWVDLGWN